MKKYNEKLFYSLVKRYESDISKKIENIKGKLVFAVLDVGNKKAFFSIAPFSMAVHNLGGDMHIIVKDGSNTNLNILKRIWRVYEEKSSGFKTSKVKALNGFINAVNKRTKTNVFKNIFKEPDVILNAKESGFYGTINLKFYYWWHRYYRWKELLQTARTLWIQGYNLRQNEKVGIGFVIIPEKEKLELPLEDYLDSYSIAYAMAIQAKRLKTRISLSASSDRASVLANTVRSVDLLSTLVGCEMDKEVDEEVFNKFKPFSKLLRINKLETNDAALGIHGKGYAGRFFFGESIGYPTLDKKTRWSSPGQMMLKDRYETQTKFETRPPKMRYAMTETLPIDIFIDTCNINYDKIRARSHEIKQILDGCETIRVIGKDIKGYKTDLMIDLIDKEGKRREFIASDSDVRYIVDREYLKKTGIKAGCYANFPSGEVFVTPENASGVFIGDVVISIDQSYIIPEDVPLIIEIKENKYRIIDGHEKLVKKMKRERHELKQKIRNYEANQSLPAAITKMYRKNFNAIGEFAINLNPKAKLCNYLIVNEKIARMIHIALGMGFEPDRKTVYHWDIVINSPRQKLDIYGIDKNKKVHWIIKKGNLAV